MGEKVRKSYTIPSQGRKGSPVTGSPDGVYMQQSDICSIALLAPPPACKLFYRLSKSFAAKIYNKRKISLLKMRLSRLKGRG